MKRATLNYLSKSDCINGHKMPLRYARSQCTECDYIRVRTPEYKAKRLADWRQKKKKVQ